MEIIKVKIKDYPEHPEGYGLVHPPSEEYILMRIIEEMPKNKKYINHFVSTGFYVDHSLEKYTPKYTDLKINLGTLEYIATVFIEDK